jgi:hypothetical protein
MYQVAQTNSQRRQVNREWAQFSDKALAAKVQIKKGKIQNIASGSFRRERSPFQDAANQAAMPTKRMFWPAMLIRATAKKAHSPTSEIFSPKESEVLNSFIANKFTFKNPP